MNNSQIATTNRLFQKNVLFISTKYFNYYNEIEKSMRSMGADVTTYIDNPYDKYNVKFLYYKLGQRFVPYVIKKYQQWILKDIKEKHFDYIFFVKGEDILTDTFLKQLRGSNPEAKFVLYEWDSVKNYNYTPFIPHFDRVYSFDTKDCEEYKLIYLPLFALNQFFKANKLPLSKRSIDFTLLASYQDHRLKTGLVIDKKVAELGKNYYFRLHSPFTWFMLHNLIKHKLSFVKKVLRWKQHFKGINFVSIDAAEWQKVLADTRVVVDLSHPQQTGLTMRTFEALASGCHLLTTNQNIKREPFYTPICITVVDKDNIELPLEISDEIIDFKNYSIDAWVKNIFNFS